MRSSQRPSVVLGLLLLTAFVFIGNACVVEADFEEGDVFTCTSNDDCTSGFECINSKCAKPGVSLLCDDLDDDGFNAGEQCNAGEVLDCDDNDNMTFPGAPEACDMKDNNCNGEIDENVDVALLGCELTEGVCGAVAPMRECIDGALVPASCTDGCPGMDCLYGADFVIEEGVGSGCGDTLDNDCDGMVDEGCPTCTEGSMCGITCIVSGTPVPDAQCPCKVGPWQTCNMDGTPGDCIDPSTMMPTRTPFLDPEIPGNMMDDNCNGTVDE